MNRLKIDDEETGLTNDGQEGQSHTPETGHCWSWQLVTCPDGIEKTSLAEQSETCRETDAALRASEPVGEARTREVCRRTGQVDGDGAEQVS